VIKIDAPITIDWLSYSTLNRSFHGNPPVVALPATQFELTASDPFMASCGLIVEMRMNFALEGENKTLWYVGLGLCVLVAVIMALAVIHCMFIGGKFNQQQQKFKEKKSRITKVQHKLNMERYK